MIENFDNTAYLAYVQRLAGALVSVVDKDRVGTPHFVRWLDRIDPESSIDNSLSFVILSRLSGIYISSNVTAVQSEVARNVRLAVG